MKHLKELEDFQHNVSISQRENRRSSEKKKKPHLHFIPVDDTPGLHWAFVSNLMLDGEKETIGWFLGNTRVHTS